MREISLTKHSNQTNYKEYHPFILDNAELGNLISSISG